MGCTTSGLHPQFPIEENMDDRSGAEKEKEEFYRSIALSMVEDLNKPNGYKWQTDNDKDISRPLQDSLNLSSYLSRAPTTNYTGCIGVCSDCNRDIGYGNYLERMGTYFHPECFCCESCGFPITEHEGTTIGGAIAATDNNSFSLSGRDAYHKSCYPKCVVCHQFVPIDKAGFIEYQCHPFWSQEYCPSHEHDNTPCCCSCERLESRNARYHSLGDGRSLCTECLESAIMDTGECQPLYHAIRDYYEGMNMKLDQQIPMLLVDTHALNKAIVGEKNGFHHMPKTRGLCLSKEQAVSSILKWPRIGCNGLEGLRTQPQKLIRKCEVTAILVLFGLPRLLTGALIAHELMHAWLRFEGYRNLNPEVEEGICEVLSYMWLESEVMPGFKSMPSTSAASSSSSSSSKRGGKLGVENKLGEFFMHQIDHDTSPTYGGGFRAANAAVNKYGLGCTLDHIRVTGNIPA